MTGEQKTLARVGPAFVSAVCGGDAGRVRALTALLAGASLREAAEAGPVAVKTLARLRDRYHKAVEGVRA